MARVIQEPISVTIAGKQPVAFSWRGRCYSIAERLDEWRDTGEWWMGESPKDFWRVRTRCGGMYDLYTEANCGVWVLYKAND